MLGAGVALLGGLGVIGRVVYGLAASPRNAKIVPIIRAAAFERYDVLDNPIVARFQPPPAFPAAAAALQKQLDGLRIG